MSNRTAVTLTLLDATSEHVRTVLDLFDEFGFEDTVGDPNTITLGHGYCATEVQGDAAEEIAATLIADTIGLGFRVSVDPTDEYMGGGIIRTPGGGEHRYECGPDGEPFVAVETLLQVQDMTDLRRVTGHALFNYVADRLVELRDLSQLDRTAPVAMCDICERRERCSCEEDAEDEAHAMNAAFDRIPAMA